MNLDLMEFILEIIYMNLILELIGLLCIYRTIKSLTLTVSGLNILQKRLKNLLKDLQAQQIFLEYKHMTQ